MAGGDVRQLAGEEWLQVGLQDALFSRIALRAEARLLVGKVAVCHVREAVLAQGQLARPQVPVLLHPGLRFRQHLYGLVVIDGARLPLALPVLINIREIVFAAILPPVRSVTLSLLWHVYPFS